MDAEGYDNFRKNMFMWRVANNVQLNDLARMTGLTHNTIGNYESGSTKQPRIETILALKHAMKLPFKELLKPCDAEPAMTVEEKHAVILYLEAERKRRKVYGYKWAEEAGIEVAKWSRLVKGKEVPYALTVYRLAMNLGYSATEILKEVKAHGKDLCRR